MGTGKPGTSVAGGGEAGEAAKGPGWNLGGKGGVGVGEGTGTRLGFLHFSKAWKTSGPIWSRWRPDLLPELSSLHCRPLFLFPSTVRPRVNRLGPFGAPRLPQNDPSAPSEPFSEAPF